ncbi:M57 family metalloprotease [Hyalangium versicolor]|uniref:M57 family metalloprotease n=1 Tax=Hyalangium versicolor TaxID=2861190 RepID=UPI001CCC0FA8|nr:M57 family metalloprotease [Hyalangium versicolor]
MIHTRRNPMSAVVALVASSVLAFGCGEQPTDTQEIIDNLLQAGFPAGEIAIVGDAVYVGGDAEVSLAASREMLQRAPGATEEHYRTANIVSASVTKICVNAPEFTGNFSMALDLAIQHYDELPLTFSMARAPSTDCSFTINAVIDPAMNGGAAGYPSNGLPYGSITLGGQTSQYSDNTIAHVLTHELGHTIGFRHSDYYNRAISCGGSATDEGTGVGAILIPGMPTDAVVGGSVMNSCFRRFEAGEFTASDVTALQAMYGMIVEERPLAPVALRVTWDGCYGRNKVTWSGASSNVQYWEGQQRAIGTMTWTSVYSGTADMFTLNVGVNGALVRVRACNWIGCSAYTPELFASYLDQCPRP